MSCQLANAPHATSFRRNSRTRLDGTRRKYVHMTYSMCAIGDILFDSFSISIATYHHACLYFTCRLKGGLSDFHLPESVQMLHQIWSTTPLLSSHQCFFVKRLDKLTVQLTLFGPSPNAGQKKQNTSLGSWWRPNTEPKPWLKKCWDAV